MLRKDKFSFCFNKNSASFFFLQFFQGCVVCWICFPISSFFLHEDDVKFLELDCLADSWNELQGSAKDLYLLIGVIVHNLSFYFSFIHPQQQQRYIVQKKQKKVLVVLSKVKEKRRKAKEKTEQKKKIERNFKKKKLQSKVSVTNLSIRFFLNIPSYFFTLIFRLPLPVAFAKIATRWRRKSIKVFFSHSSYLIWTIVSIFCFTLFSLFAEILMICRYLVIISQFVGGSVQYLKEVLRGRNECKEKRWERNYENSNDTCSVFSSEVASFWKLMLHFLWDLFIQSMVRKWQGLFAHIWLFSGVWIRFSPDAVSRLYRAAATNVFVVVLVAVVVAFAAAATAVDCGFRKGRLNWKKVVSAYANTKTARNLLNLRLSDLADRWYN